MDGLALVMWIVTIGGGATLAAVWTLYGGAKHSADVDTPMTGSGQVTTNSRSRSRIALSVLVSHATLGIVGAVVWQLYRANKGDMA